MSFGALNISSAALNAFQDAENVISNDIANVNTPGASNQNPIFTERVPIAGTPGYPANVTPGTIGEGTTVSEIQRVHENALDALYRGSYSSANYYSAINNGLSTIQSAFNEPNGGISNAYNTFLTAVSQLASVNSSSANASSDRQNVLSTAQALTSALNNAGGAVATQQTTDFNQAENIVTSINGILDQIGSLNGEIRASTAAGDNPNTYLDQRDQLVDQLSQYVPTTTINETNGSTLITVNGKALVNDTVVYHLAVPQILTNSSGNPTLTISFKNDPNPNNPTPLQLGNGELGGLVDLYNNQLVGYTNQLNSFSSALAQQVNTINESGYDQNGQAGQAIFGGVTTSGQITASSINVALNSSSQIAMVSASTTSGTLTDAVNASNVPVTTSTIFNSATAPNAGNILFNNPPATGGISGTLRVAVDGVSQTFAYNSLTTDTSIGAFITRFNAAQMGVTASYDPIGEEVSFTRDPSNESLAMQALPGYTPSPSFTITDSNGASGVQPAAGTTSTSLLAVLGLGQINGVQQNASNAYGANGNANAVQMQSALSAAVGIPPVSTALSAATVAGLQTVSLPGGLGNIAVGQVLTIDAGTAHQENVTVTAVNATSVPPTFDAVFQNPHNAGATIQAAPVGSLSQFYQNFIGTLGFDAQGAQNAMTTQTNLTSSIDTQRQSVDGINIDTETQKLVQYQVAYQAVAKTFSVMESLLTSTINQLIP